MTLSVTTLRESGGFAGAPVKREVTWQGADGEEHTADVYVRRLSYHSAISDLKHIQDDGDIAAARIATCIVDEEGRPVFEVHDITGVYADGSPVLDDDGQERGGIIGSLVMALLVIIGEVNDLGKSKTTG